jgi:hypothetical protein
MWNTPSSSYPCTLLELVMNCHHSNACNDGAVRLILCFQQNQWDWQPHCELGQSSLVVLCAGSTLLLALKLPRAINYFLAPCQKPVSNNLQKWFFSPTGQLNFDFILRENLLLCSSYLPLGVSQRVLWDITTLEKLDRFLVSREWELLSLLLLYISLSRRYQITIL